MAGLPSPSSPRIPPRGAVCVQAPGQSGCMPLRIAAVRPTASAWTAIDRFREAYNGNLCLAAPASDQVSRLAQRILDCCRRSEPCDDGLGSPRVSELLGSQPRRAPELDLSIRESETVLQGCCGRDLLAVQRERIADLSCANVSAWTPAAGRKIPATTTKLDVNLTPPNCDRTLLGRKTQDLSLASQLLAAPRVLLV